MENINKNTNIFANAISIEKLEPRLELASKNSADQNPVISSGQVIIG